MDKDTIAFITDTHLGCDENGFFQQPRRPDLWPRIFKGLKSLMQENDVQLLIHGGDLVEFGRREDISEVTREIQGMDVDSLVCLGNHDLMDVESKQWWDELSRESPRIHWADSVVKLSHADIIAMNTHWMGEGEPQLHWSAGSNPHESILTAQLDWLEQELEKGTNGEEQNRPAVLVFHAPLEALPPRLTGSDQPLHVPTATYADRIQLILDRHPRVKLVLSGHNHVTCATARNGRVHLSTSSLVESPFEFRLIHFTSRSFQIKTQAVIPMTADIAYDADKAWVNGQAQDRTLFKEW